MSLMSLSLSLCAEASVVGFVSHQSNYLISRSSIKHSLGTLDDVPIQVCKFVILCESSYVPIILGQTFLATIEAVINVLQARSLSSCVKRGSTSIVLLSQLLLFLQPKFMSSQRSIIC